MPVGRNLSEAVFCSAVALSARPSFALRASERSLRSFSVAGLRSNTLFAFLPAQGRGFLQRRVKLL